MDEELKNVVDVEDENPIDNASTTNQNQNTDNDDDEEEVNYQSFDDDGTEENPNEDNDESDDKNQPVKSYKKELSKEERSKYAELRRESEYKERIAREAYEKGLVEAVDGINPFTQEAIETKADIEEFLNMREAAKNGYDPVSEYSKFLKEKNMKQTTSISSKDFDYQTDKKSFEEAYPDIDLNKLAADPDFADFAEDLIGKIPLKEVYKKFEKFEAKLRSEVDKRVIREMSKGKSSPGSLENKLDKKSKSFGDMDDEEFERQIQLAKTGGLRGI